MRRRPRDLCGRLPGLTVTVDQALEEAEETLAGGRVDAPRLTARVLLGDALARHHAWIVAHGDEQLTANRLSTFREMVRRRAGGTPLQYIRGKQEFYGLDFRVTPDALIPRPETEHLVEAALERISPGDCVLDIGTGSGAVAVTLAKLRSDARVFAADVSRPALSVAASNAARLGCPVPLCATDLCAAFRSRRFDMVVSNPPYIPLQQAASLQRELRFEPSVALYGGEDGLQVIARLARESPRILKTGGWLLMEIGFGSRAAVERLLRAGGWTGRRFLTDLAGIDRVAVARHGGS